MKKINSYYQTHPILWNLCMRVLSIMSFDTWNNFMYFIVCLTFPLTRLFLHWKSIPESWTSTPLPWPPLPWHWHVPAFVLLWVCSNPFKLNLFFLKDISNLNILNIFSDCWAWQWSSGFEFQIWDQRRFWLVLLFECLCFIESQNVESCVNAPYPPQLWSGTMGTCFWKCLPLYLMGL